MHIVVAGGSGFLGSALRRRLEADGHRVTVLTRHPRRPGDAPWNPAAPPADWARPLDGADAVVNLSGEGIGDRRWTARRKAAIRDSRLLSTRAVVGAIAAAPRPPATFVNASGVGIYGPRGDEPITEETPPGDDFLSEVGVAWESEALRVPPGVRVVLLRSGVVLDRRGGALPRMALPFHFFAGGPLGSGRQYLPWIHLHDWVELARWTLTTAAASGPINATAPETVTNREFTRALGRALGRPSLLPAPAFALRLILGEMSVLVLEGQRVIPAKAERLGFEYRYPRLEPALRNIYSDEPGRTQGGR